MININLLTGTNNSNKTNNSSLLKNGYLKCDSLNIFHIPFYNSIGYFSNNTPSLRNLSFLKT